MVLRLVFCLLLSAGFCAIAQETVPVAPAVQDSTAHNAPMDRVKADTSVDLEAVVVKGKHRKFVETKENQKFTGSTVTKEGIATLGGSAQTSVDHTLALLPSVNVESIDPYGLNRPLQNSYMRIRGQSNDPVGYNLDGIPLGTGTRFGPRENSFDMENFSDITLYRGASPSDQSSGFSNYAGTIAINTLKPLDQPGFTFNQSSGTFGFERIFVRANTGKILPNFKSFLSYSYASSDKWCGLGGVDRKRATFGADFSPSSKIVSGQIAIDYQKLTSDNYRGLSYAQTRNLHANYSSDFNTSLTGDSAQDVYYYKFNKIDDNYLFIHGNIQIKPADAHTFNIKPYFSHDAIDNFDYSAGSKGITDWKSKRTRGGSLFDYKTRLFDTDLSLGYWIEMFKWPAFTRKTYTVSRTHIGELAYQGWAKSLLTYDGYFRYDSPYLSINKAINKLNANVGLKYFKFTQPATTAYKNTNIGDVSEEDFDKHATKDTNACVGSKSTGVVLPSAAISYALNDHIAPYFDYGRGYEIAYFGPGGIISGYWSNRNYFDSLGITADKLADNQKIQTADNFDLGVRLKFGLWNITPSAFYTSYKYKSVAIWDPITKVSYRQTVGDADAYGTELEVAGTLFSGLSFFASGAYDKAKFSENIPASSKDTSDIKGNQFPDCPEYMAKLGISYTPNFLPGFEISPVLRYVGSRFGDISNVEKVLSYKVADITLAYKLKNIASSLKNLTLNFSVLNVTNAEYISYLSVSDEARGAATYYAGYPRTVTWSVQGTF